MRLSIQNCRCRPWSAKATHQPLRGGASSCSPSSQSSWQLECTRRQPLQAHQTLLIQVRAQCQRRVHVTQRCWSAGVAAPGPRTSVCRPRVHLIEITLDEGRGDLQECRHELVLMTPCSSFIDAALSSGIDILRFVAGQSGRQRLSVARLAKGA